MEIHCFRCPMILDEPGGLLFGPPTEGVVEDIISPAEIVSKIHLCRECWNDLMGLKQFWETYKL